MHIHLHIWWKVLGFNYHILEIGFKYPRFLQYFKNFYFRALRPHLLATLGDFTTKTYFQVTPLVNSYDDTYVSNIARLSQSHILSYMCVSKSFHRHQSWPPSTLSHLGAMTIQNSTTFHVIFIYFSSLIVNGLWFWYLALWIHYVFSIVFIL